MDSYRKPAALYGRLSHVESKLLNVISEKDILYLLCGGFTDPDERLRLQVGKRSVIVELLIRNGSTQGLFDVIFQKKPLAGYFGH